MMDVFKVSKIHLQQRNVAYSSLKDRRLNISVIEKWLILDYGLPCLLIPIFNCWHVGCFARQMACELPSYRCHQCGA